MFKTKRERERERVESSLPFMQPENGFFGGMELENALPIRGGGRLSRIFIV